MKRGFLYRNAELFELFFRVIDTLIIVAAGVLSYLFRMGSLHLPVHYQIALIVVTFITITAFGSVSVYRSWRGASITDEFGRILLAMIVVVILSATIASFTKTGAMYSRLWFGTWMLSSFFVFLLIRLMIRSVLKWARISGYNQRTVAIFGAGKLGRRVLRQIQLQPWTGLRVVAFYDDDIALSGKIVDGVPINGTISEYLSQKTTLQLNEGQHPGHRNDKISIDQAWIALPLSAEKIIQSISAAFSNTTTSVHFVPDIFGYNLLNHSIDEFAGMPVINLSTTPIIGTNQLAKNLEDWIVSILAITITAPIMLIIAILIKLDSPGAIIFKQRRYGLDGKEIEVWKFRTMRVMEDGATIHQATKDDPRVTKIGVFLRKTSLDELPQFFNVLQGRMSVVGPRPHAIAHNEEYRGIVDRYMVRHTVKPGITGWAQVNGWRGETDTIEKMKKRVEFDLEYLSNWSIWLDLKIIFHTIIRGFVNTNAY